MIHDFRQIYTLSLVVIGNFNPAIIQPFWLSQKGLIREQEAQDAKIDLIHPELVRWKLDWLIVEVTPSRFEVRTSQEPYFEITRDLLTSIFDILKETPINSFGLNHLMYFALPDEKRYYDFGKKLVPLKVWSEFLSDPRVMNVEVSQLKRNDGYKGSSRIKVMPSDIKLTTPYAFTIQINDHFDLQKNSQGFQESITVLNDVWESSLIKAVEYCNKLWES